MEMLGMQLEMNLHNPTLIGAGHGDLGIGNVVYSTIVLQYFTSDFGGKEPISQPSFSVHTDATSLPLLSPSCPALL